MVAGEMSDASQQRFQVNRGGVLPRRSKRQSGLLRRLRYNGAAGRWTGYMMMVVVVMVMVVMMRGQLTGCSSGRSSGAFLGHRRWVAGQAVIVGFKSVMVMMAIYQTR